MEETKKEYRDAGEVMVKVELKGYSLDPLFPGQFVKDQETSNPQTKVKEMSFLEFLNAMKGKLDEIFANHSVSDRDTFNVQFGANRTSGDGAFSKISGLWGEILSGIKLKEQFIEKMNLIGESPFKGVTFEDITFHECKFTGDLFKGCKFIRSKFTECEFWGAQLTLCHFSGAVFQKGKVLDSNHVPNGPVIHEDIEKNADVKPSFSNFNNSEFINCTFSEVHFDKSNFSSCSFDKTIFNQSNFFINILQGSTYGGCTFKTMSITENCKHHLSSHEKEIIFTETERPSIDIKRIHGSTFEECHLWAEFPAMEFSDNTFSKCKSDKSVSFKAGTNIGTLTIRGCNIYKFQMIKIKCESLIINTSEIHEVHIEQCELKLITIDLHSFKSIKKVHSGYKALNGIVFQNQSDQPNFSSTIQLLNPVDSGIGKETEPILENLRQARRLLGVYFITVAIGLISLFKELGIDGFGGLSVLPVVGPLVDLSLESFLLFLPFPIILLLMITLKMDEALRWLPFLKGRDAVTQITGFSWTLTQYIPPHEWKGREKVQFWGKEDLKKHWNWYGKMAVSYVLRTVMIFSGPLVYFLLIFSYRESTSAESFLSLSLTLLPLILLLIIYYHIKSINLFDKNYIVISFVAFFDMIAFVFFYAYYYASNYQELKITFEISWPHLYHFLSMVFFVVFAIWLFCTSNKFQRPLVFNFDK